jgi:DNA-binding response OmpR family regulator
MSPHVLVVVDSLTRCMDLNSLLAVAGFSVTACETIAAAQSALKKNFALAILDVVLPDGDGIELLEEIRANPETMSMPIILLSNTVDVKRRIQGLSAGADEYIGKPYDRSYLVRRAMELTDKRQACPATLAGSSNDSISGKKVLIVDDSVTYRKTLSYHLRQVGCDVIPASSGEEALNLLGMSRVDCVIMDLMMPGIGGMEAARRIKSSPATSQIPVMILTGLDDIAMQEEVASVGVDRYVKKSSELPVLKALLRSLMFKEEPRAAGAAGATTGLAAGSWASESPPQSSNDVAEPKSSRSGAELRDQSIPPTSLLAEVIAASGLSAVIGPSTVARACRRAGVDPETLTPSGLVQALPSLKETLRVFLPAHEYEQRIAAIMALANSISAIAWIFCG